MKPVPATSLGVDMPKVVIEDIKKPKYGVEYFHIYTDETIEERHALGIDYLRAAEQSWNFDYERIVMIDNYNPKVHVLTADMVLNHLYEQGILPHYWAHEGDLLQNAEQLLAVLTNNKLKKNYVSYIERNKKYPCSLLTATWYLTRLGRFSAEGVIRSTDPSGMTIYQPVERLINLLPYDYKPVEARARELIVKSIFSEDAERIQDLFYPVDSGRALELF